ncbi:MAG: 23S rRNA (uracil(1939)-C(5))-methyltransferase RlmD [Syntrophorhabdaceae bacterium]|nr:23S rRNA (uracil(1939)-C(5))-methyltransferase RlmD [Syntrophorhabdaceae bacterium]
MPAQKHLEVEIIDIALPDGFGVGKINGAVVFIPGGIPGDILSVRVVREEKNFLVGMMEGITFRSPFRVEPLCPHAESCGGCTFQSLSYEKQLEIKKNHLLQTLKRIGGFREDVEIEGVVPSPDIYFYRNNLELSFGGDESLGEHLWCGMKERVTPINRFTGKVTPIERCMIFSELLERLIPLWKDFLRKNRFEPYDPRSGRGFLRHLTVRESKHKGELMLILETKEGLSVDFRCLKDHIPSVAPQVTSLYWVINKRAGDYLHIDERHLIFGKPFIEEVLSGLHFRIYPGTFFQSNTKAAEALYREIPILGGIKRDDRVAGLYCGTGTIEISIARMCHEVLGVDGAYENIKTAKENAMANRVQNVSFHHGRVEDFRGKIKGGNIDLLIVDPPRGGISKKGIELILSINPERLIYVSCNPATLARDLKVLTERNYKIVKVVPFDFFPHTPHMEVLTSLSRK